MANFERLTVREKNYYEKDIEKTVMHMQERSGQTAVNAGHLPIVESLIFHARRVPSMYTPADGVDGMYYQVGARLLRMPDIDKFAATYATSYVRSLALLSMQAAVHHVTSQIHGSLAFPLSSEFVVMKHQSIPPNGHEPQAPHRLHTQRVLFHDLMEAQTVRREDLSRQIQGEFKRMTRLKNIVTWGNGQLFGKQAKQHVAYIEGVIEQYIRDKNNRWWLDSLWRSADSD